MAGHTEGEAAQGVSGPSDTRHDTAETLTSIVASPACVVWWHCKPFSEKKNQKKEGWVSERRSGARTFLKRERSKLESKYWIQFRRKCHSEPEMISKKVRQYKSVLSKKAVMTRAGVLVPDGSSGNVQPYSPWNNKVPPSALWASSGLFLFTVIIQLFPLKRVKKKKSWL